MLLDKNTTRRISKKLSYVLRHAPESIGLELDQAGWAKTEELVQKLHFSNVELTLEKLKYIVEINDKQRFAFNDDQTKIRASQGHSITIQLAYEPSEPPEILFHGTATKFIDSIRNQGLQKQKRHHVHLSLDVKTARKVGERHGKVVILEVKAGQMFRDGNVFYCSENEVWLTDNVPVSYLTFP